MPKTSAPATIGIIAILGVVGYLLFFYYKIQNYLVKPSPTSGTSAGTSPTVGGSNPPTKGAEPVTTTTQPAPASGQSQGQTPEQKSADISSTLDYAGFSITTIPSTTKTLAQLSQEASSGSKGTSAAAVQARYIAQQKYIASPENKFTTASEKAAAQNIQYVPKLSGVDNSVIINNAKSNPPASSRAGLINVSLLAALGKLQTTLTAEQVLGLPQRENF